jgi:hypothetical protein
MPAPLAVGSFILSPNATSTIVMAPLCTPASIVTYSAMTPHAANSVPLVSVVPGSGMFVVNHENNSRTDRMFSYAVVG